MINILTYPNDSGSHYIDPDYLGDDSSGFQKRIKDFRDGNYQTLNSGTPPGSVDSIMENGSRFKYYLKHNSYSGNPAIYDFWYLPMIRGTVNGSGVITAVDIITYGNQRFRQRTGASSYTGSARIKSNKRFWKEGNSSVSIASTIADISISAGSDGYIDSVTLNSGGSGYGSAGYVMFEIEQAAADTYPATPTAIEAADTWDTDDEWLDAGSSSLKRWPTTVVPESAEVKVDQPSTVTRSQSGKKYVNSSGFTKWGLEVSYPPMTGEQFKTYAGVVQAARGQAIPFYFDLHQGGSNIIWARFNSNNSANNLIIKDDVSAESQVILLEGLTTGDSLNVGDTIGGANGDLNGEINTIINTANANAYGEAKVRLAYAVRNSLSAGDKWTTAPEAVVVTLTESSFEYTVGADNLYRMTVLFELDEWK